MPDPTPPSSPDLDDGPDPFARLERLAPSVDLDLASGAFGRLRTRRARRRRMMQGALVAVVLLVAGVAVAATRSDPDHRSDHVLAGPTRTAHRRSADATVTRTGHGVEMTVVAPRGGTIGTHVTFEVRLRNVSDHDVRVAGGTGDCSPQVQAGLRPLGTDPSTDVAPRSPYAADASHWNGRFDELVGHLRKDDGPRPLPAHVEPSSGWERETVCAAIALAPVPLHPGAVKSYPMSVDLRWGIGAVPERMQLSVWSGPLEVPKELGPIDHKYGITITTPFRLHDDPVRRASVGDVLRPGTLADAPTFDTWVVETSYKPFYFTPNGKQAWVTDLSWWRGRWELWVDPLYGNMATVGPLLVRWDPKVDGVVDVRMTRSGNGGASDDPEAPPGTSVDHVRYHRN